MKVLRPKAPYSTQTDHERNSQHHPEEAKFKALKESTEWLDQIFSNIKIKELRAVVHKVRAASEVSISLKAAPTLTLLYTFLKASMKGN